MNAGCYKDRAVRSYQVFAALPPETAQTFFDELVEKAPGVAAQALAAASAAMRARPRFMARQARDKQAAAVRRCLARVASNPLADEMLAVYFLECRKDLLVEWLDTARVSHDDGTLTEEAPPEPDAEGLALAVDTFRKGEDPGVRELLLGAFAAQGSIEWPALEALVAPEA